MSHMCAVLSDGALGCSEFGEIPIRSDIRMGWVPTSVILPNSSAVVRAFLDHPGILCSICLRPPSKISELVATACGHVFHSACIDSWMRQSLECPNCRQMVLR